MKRQEVRLTSSILPGDTYTAPLRVVLHESHSSTVERPEYVTHHENMQTGELFSGHYFNTRRDTDEGQHSDQQADNAARCRALADYAARCRQLFVDPLPSAEVQAIPAGIPRPTRAATDTATGMSAADARELNRQGTCPMD